MSAIADLINKVLWKCTVYIQGLDLRAESTGVGYSLIQFIPHTLTQTRTHTRKSDEQIMLLNDNVTRVLHFIFFCDNIP